MDDNTPNLGRLLDEAAWLRRLARHLVSQPGAAEDVVQETWAAALAQQGRQEILAPRAWLGRIARRAAGRTRRSAGRRAEREAEHATRRGDDPAPGLDEVAGRLELQRIVGEELEGLSEPYRSVLFQQYYEGLAPQEIGQRTGVDPGTIRWRAKRGRELLREALVARDGRAWESWALLLAPIAGLPLPASVVTSAAATPVAIAMTTKWILSGVAAGALAVLGIRAVASEPTPATSASLERASSSATESRPADLVPVPPGAAGRSPATPEAESSASAAISAVIARGRLRSARSGADVERGRVVFTRADGLEVQASVEGAAWGAVGLAPGEWTLSATADGHADYTQGVSVPALAVWDHDVTLAPTGTIHVRVEDLAGDDLPERFRAFRELGWALAVLPSESPLPARVERAFESWSRSPAGEWRGRRDLDHLPHLAPRFLGELHLSVPAPVHVALLVGTEVLEQRRLVRLENELVLRIDPTRLERALGSAHLRVVDTVSGESLTGSEVSANLRVLGPLSHVIHMRSADERLALDGLPPGAYELTVEGRRRGDWPTLTRRVVVETGAALDLGELSLARCAPVRVRVRGEAPLARAILSATHAGPAPGSYAFEPAVDWGEGDGTFVMNGLPAGAADFTLELADGRRFAFPTTSVQVSVDVTLALDEAHAVEGER